MKLSLAAGALCLVGALYSLFGQLDQLGAQYDNLQSNLFQVQQSVDRQIGSVSSRVEEILKAQNSLTADYGVEIVSADLAKNQVTFSARAVPKTYTQGMTVAFTADSGTGDLVSAPGQSAPDGGYTARLTCTLSDAITISAVFVQTDGTRSTQLLEQFTGLYSASMPAVQVLEGGHLWGVEAEPGGRITLPEIILSAVPSSTVMAVEETVGQAEAAQIQMGLFLNHSLLTYLEPWEDPDVSQGDGDALFFRLAPGRVVTLAEKEDQVCFAAVVTDVYGRQAVYGDVPYILSEDGDLTYPSAADLSHHDPFYWGLS